MHKTLNFLKNIFLVNNSDQEKLLKIPKKIRHSSIIKFSLTLNHIKTSTYFIDEDALLLMVRFSASDASDESKSPVRTLPGWG